MIDDETPEDIRDFVLHEIIPFNEYVLFRKFEKVDLGESGEVEPVPKHDQFVEYVHQRAVELVNMGKLLYSHILVHDKYFAQYGVKVYVLSPWQRLVLRINGRVFVKYGAPRGFDTTAFYIVRCHYHDVYFLDYLHGNSEYTTCPYCRSENV